MNILAKSKKSKARILELKTPHGKLEAPFFMPDATRAVLKGLSMKEIKELGLPAMVVNTFHLFLQPGAKRIKDAGGVHKFMNVDIPLVSDSGGFQVFSLIHKSGKMGKITEEGASFKSPIDGSMHDLSPESSIKVQLDLGTDIVICLDDCPPHDISDEKMKESIDRTVRWARKCKDVFESELLKRSIPHNNRPLLIAVIQGGESIELRKYCADKLRTIGFDGYGFGARPVDSKGNFLDEVLAVTAESSPDDKIRFALGIGTPEDIVRCVKMGYDLFDCVIPTREGRHARLFYFRHEGVVTKKGAVAKFYSTANMNNSKYARDDHPINPDSKLNELRGYSKSYLHHLFKVRDPLAARLASLNNLEFYTVLLNRIREAIKQGDL